MKKIFPNKLKSGDVIRVIAPARSLSIISDESRNIAKSNFDKLGLKLTFGKHVEESDEFISSSIESRVEDLHNAFSDKEVKAILTVIGGFNSNQLLKYIDWELIKSNPKILCGYSDITALNNSILKKTGLVTYYGPHYSTLGQKLYLDYTLNYFKLCLMESHVIDVKPSSKWTDDAWYIDQKNRHQIENNGFIPINSGKAEGSIVGGNLCTFNLLQGTEYMPSLENSVLFIEDDYESDAATFDRDLQSLIHLQDFKGVKGIVIGRFQKESKISVELLNKIIKTKKELAHIPVVAGVDFGHTEPKITFPIGGSAKISVMPDTTNIEITKH